MKKLVTLLSVSVLGLAVVGLVGPGCSPDPSDSSSRDAVAPALSGPGADAPVETNIIEYEPYRLYKGTTFPDAFALSTRTGRGTSTVLWDPTETVVLATLTWSASAGTVTWDVPGVGQDVDDYDGFQVKLSGSDAAVYYIYKSVQAALASQRGGSYDPWADEGCDYFPDILETECVLACCAIHDDCWAQNDCGLSSWIPFVGSSECKACNRAVVKCIAKCALKAIGIGEPQQH